MMSTFSKMKVSVMIVGLLLVIALVAGCSENNSDSYEFAESTPANAMTTTNTPEPTTTVTPDPTATTMPEPTRTSTGAPIPTATPKPTNTPTKAPTQAPTVTPTPPLVPLQQVKLTFTDVYGYKLEAELKISPWMLYSTRKEQIEDVWNRVGSLDDRAELITPESFTGFYKDGDYFCYRLDGYPQIAFPGTGKRDYYYAVGELKVRNVTIGESFSFNENNTYTPELSFGGTRWEWEEKVYPYYTSPMAMAISYSGGTKYAYGLFLSINPLMKSNRWGPVKFVIILNEIYTPNKPDGLYGPLLEEHEFDVTFKNFYTGGNEETIPLKMSVLK